jgi:hypothetical protein
MYQEAVEAPRKSISIEGENTIDQCYLGYALAMSGQRDGAQAILDKLKGSKEYVSPAEPAMCVNNNQRSKFTPPSLCAQALTAPLAERAAGPQTSQFFSLL